MALEIRARLSDGRLDAAAPDSQRILHIALSAPVAPGEALPLNLALVLDRSGSMRGVALDCLKEAARHIVGALGPRDRVAIVGFNDEPTVLVSMRPATDPAAIGAAVDALEAGGGTCIDGGMDLALRELRQAGAPTFLDERAQTRQGPSVNRVFVLTDGHNQHGDDERCVALARRAVADRVAFSTFGIGEKFSVDVLRDVANAGNGMLHHVPTPQHIAEAFSRELEGVQRIGATQVQVMVRLEAGIDLGAKDPVCMVSPAIVPQQPLRETGGFALHLGDMPAGGPTVLLATLYLGPRPPGAHVVATIEASYEDSAGTRGAGPVEVRGEWVARYYQEIDPEVQAAIARMAIYKQRQKAIELAASHPDLARTMLQSATELALRAGNEELRTVLAATLTELQRDGRISDRTRIQGEVASRTVLQ